MSMTSEGLRPKMPVTHGRTGHLDKPESCHDRGRAAALNALQASPANMLEVRLSSASLFALLKLALSRGEAMAAKFVVGSQGGGVTREDVAALVEHGYAEPRKGGYSITDRGNALVRELVTFATRWKGVEVKAKHGKPKHPAHEVVMLTNAGTRKRLVYHAPSPGNAAGLALNRDDVRQVISSRLADGTKGGES